MTALMDNAFRLTVRDEAGGSACNKLRRAGMVPGVLYGARKDPVPLSIDERDIVKGLHNTNFFTTIYELALDGKKERAMVRAVQYHPVTDRPIHIDFMRVAKGAKITVRVPVIFNNEELSPGIKNGGVLNVVLHSIDVTCSVDYVPDHFEVDLTGLEIGSGIHLDQINLGEGVSVTHPERDNTIATIAAPTVHKVEAETAPETEEGEATKEDSAETKD
jgi:large subunit ribosomal protein L25